MVESKVSSINHSGQKSKHDPVREPGDKSVQFSKNTSLAGLGTSFRYFTANQGNLQFKTGLFGGISQDAKPIFDKLESETVYDSSVNAQCVIGPYKPRGQISKRMAKGEKGIATIDLVAGRMGSYARSFENDEDIEELRKELRIAEAQLKAASNFDVDDVEVPAEALSLYQSRYQKYSYVKGLLQSKVDATKSKKIFAINNYKVDAARIVVCQKGDVDEDFGLRPGKVGSSVARSFVAMKADSVRITARESIKLVTGTDNENSQGGRIDVPRGIDLIGANDDQDMQPLVKGSNLLECLDDMNENISALNGIVMDFLTQQLLFNTTLAFHVHIDPLSGITGPSGEVLFAWATSIPQTIGVTFSSIIANKINNGRVYIRYLIPKPFLEDKFICSKYNNTN
jgi:hypothetical protein